MTGEYLVYYRSMTMDADYEGDFVVPCEGDIDGRAFLEYVRGAAAALCQGERNNIVIKGVFKL